MDVLVDSRVRLPLAYVHKHHGLLEQIQKLFTHENPAFKKYEQLRERMRLPKADIQPTIRSWQEETRFDESVTPTVATDWISVPRGGLHKVREALTAAGVAFTLLDRRTNGTPLGGSDMFPAHQVDPWPFQAQAIEALAKRQNCILRAPTGSGKTTAALGLAAKLGVRALVVVPTTAVFKVWIERIQSELGLTKKQIGVLKGARRKLGPITVAMQGTVASMAKRGLLEPFLDEFGLVICDEVHRFAAPTFIAAVDPWPAKYRVGVSADETRKDRKEFLIYDIFGQVAADIKRRDLIEQGYILDVQICVIPTDFQARWYAMKPDIHRLLDEMRRDTRREALIHQVVRQEAGEGFQVMVLSHRVEHVQQIDHALVILGVQSGTLLAGESEYDRTIQGLKDRRLAVAVGTVQALGTGLDLPKLDVGVLTTPLANHKQEFGQVRGRICRRPEGKDRARLYYLWDRHVYGRKALENLCAWNDQVVVRSGSTWVDGREYLRRMAADRAARRARAWPTTGTQ